MPRVVPGATIRADRTYWRGRLVGVTYRWEAHPLGGDPSVALVEIFDGDCRRPGDVVTIGPFRLRVLDYSLRYLADVVMLDGWRARWRLFWWPALDALHRTYVRLVLTASVWGLATTEQGRVPSWRDMRGIERLARWWNAYAAETAWGPPPPPSPAALRLAEYRAFLNTLTVATLTAAPLTAAPEPIWQNFAAEAFTYEQLERL